MAVGEDAYCTLVMTDSYLPGAAVLANSLRDCGTTKKLAALGLYDYVIPVDRIGNPNPKNLYLMNRGDLLYTFTKINLWRQTQFRKIVYLDADVVALRAPEELFDTREDFAAAPDVGWPDAFNTGVMVISPHMGTHWALRTLASAGDSFDGADQGLLNQYYEHKPWKRLSFKYNCTPSANYQYEPAYRFYKHDISMVHFIGDHKPWRGARKANAPPSAYQELLSRWWAVYDRHISVGTHEYTETGRREQGAVSANGGAAASLSSSTEVPFTEPGEAAENIDQGLVAPRATAEARRFSAPQSEWDATRAPPPATSRPEAANFPHQIYDFNNDPTPFHAPSSYPEPPKDMWYEVPSQPPRREDKPPPIFPWEERTVPKPTRTFAPSAPPSPPPSASPPFAHADELSVQADDLPTPTTPSIQVSSPPANDFSATSKNAWDDIQGIDSYVRALSDRQFNRAKVSQGYQEGPQPQTEPGAVLAEQVRQRRESLILTDFPSAVERPSLPVTPAPRARSSFWGEERDETGNLPAAEGVPDQADWNPDEQLETLRRNSVLSSADLKMPQRKLSARSMPTTAADIHPAAAAPSSSSLATVAEEHAPPTSSKPTFATPDFGASGVKSEEAVLSPTEHGSRDFGQGVV
ncbi:glycogenin glucosyltransferase [Oleoguttula sp. CCFEE 5521]